MKNKATLEIRDDTANLQKGEIAIWDSIRAKGQSHISQVEWMKIVRNARIKALGSSSCPRDSDKTAHMAIAEELVKQGYSMILRGCRAFHVF